MSQNITLLGASYPDVPGVLLPKTGGGTASFVDVTDTTAAAGDVASGKLFYAADGTLTTGTASGGGGGTVKMGALRPDAELVQTWSYDKKIHADEGVTIPSYSTSNQTLKAAAVQSTTYQLEPTSYNYILIYRALAYPIYNSSSKAKGRQEYFITSGGYELAQFPSGIFKAIVDSTTSASSNYFIVALSASNALVYWGSGTSLFVSNNSYGAYMSMTTNPSVSSSQVLTVTSPVLYIRGSSSYFSSTYWSYITDIRYQWIFELYRTPISASVKGWERMSQIYHGINCVQSTSHTLT